MLIWESLAHAGDCVLKGEVQSPMPWRQRWGHCHAWSPTSWRGRGEAKPGCWCPRSCCSEPILCDEGRATAWVAHTVHPLCHVTLELRCPQSVAAPVSWGSLTPFSGQVSLSQQQLLLLTKVGRPPVGCDGWSGKSAGDGNADR